MGKGVTTILDDMLTLDLDLTETMVYAIIFGFSQDGEFAFTGSQAYLAKKCKCSRHKVITSLSKLVERGLVAKTDRTINGIKFCEYRVSPMGTGCTPQVQGGCTPEVHNNIDNINIDNNSPYKKSSSHFQKPSLEDVRAYCISRSNKVDPEQFFNFYESKGWIIGKSPMKDWRAAVRTWEKREKEIPQRKRSPLTKNESVLEHNLKVMDQMFGTNLHEQAYGNKGGHADEQ